jgi:hypothetical protein
MWLLVNLILDAMIAWYAFNAAGFGLLDGPVFLRWYCSTPIGIPNDPIEYDPSTCQSFGRAIQICAGFALFSGVGLAYVSSLFLFFSPCL